MTAAFVCINEKAEAVATTQQILVYVRLTLIAAAAASASVLYFTAAAAVSTVAVMGLLRTIV